MNFGMLKSIKKSICYIWDSVFYITGEGSWNLLKHESEVIKGVRIFDETVNEKIKKQLNQDYFVERSSEGRINIFRFYDFDDALLIKGEKFQDFLLKVCITVNGKRNIGHLTFYKGRIFSVEFKKSKAYFNGKNLEFVNAEIGKTQDAYTRVIDRSEHGRANED